MAKKQPSPRALAFKEWANRYLKDICWHNARSRGDTDGWVDPGKGEA